MLNDLLNNVWFTTDTIISVTSDAILEQVDFAGAVTINVSEQPLIHKIHSKLFFDN